MDRHVIANKEIIYRQELTFTNTLQEWYIFRHSQWPTLTFWEHQIWISFWEGLNTCIVLLFEYVGTQLIEKRMSVLFKILLFI